MIFLNMKISRFLSSINSCDVINQKYFEVLLRRNEKLYVSGLRALEIGDNFVMLRGVVC